MNAVESIDHRPLTLIPKMKSCCTAEATSTSPAERVSAAPANRRSRHQIQSRRRPRPSSAKPSQRRNQPKSTDGPSMRV